MTTNVFQRERQIIFSKDCFATFCQNKTGRRNETEHKESFSKNKQGTKKFLIQLNICLSGEDGEKSF